MRRSTLKVRRGTAFTLVELLVVIAIIALLVSILLPSLAGVRKAARLGICTSNMRQHATGMMNYATDSKGWLSTFSWEANRSYSEYADLNNAPNAPEAHANQAIDAIRRFLGNNQQRVSDRMLSRNYSYLVLVVGGYFGDRLPEAGVVCPEDRDPLIWQRNYSSNPNTTNPAVIFGETADPDPSSSTAFKLTLPFWSTYQTVPAVWTIQTGAGCMTQATGATPGYHLLYTFYPTLTKFNNTRMDQVMFPANKVYQFDLWDRHKFSRPLFHAYPIAAQPLVFFDGSVNIRQTGKANQGWNPATPTSPNPTVYNYTPRPGEPPTLSGNATDTVRGYYRWTRGGIRGIDYGGGEVGPGARP